MGIAAGVKGDAAGGSLEAPNGDAAGAGEAPKGDSAPLPCSWVGDPNGLAAGASAKGDTTGDPCAAGGACCCAKGLSCAGAAKGEASLATG